MNNSGGGVSSSMVRSYCITFDKAIDNLCKWDRGKMMLHDSAEMFEDSICIT